MAQGEESVWGSVLPQAGLHTRVGLDLQRACGAESAEHRVGAGGCVGAQGRKAVYLASGCLCARVCGLCKPA